MGVFQNNLLAGAAAAASAGGGGFYSHQIEHSTRWDGSNERLLRTIGTASNDKIATISIWLKKANNGTYSQIFHTYDGGGINFMWYDSDQLYSNVANSPDSGYSDAVFRDNNAWMHIVSRVDTTQSSNADRVRVYQNGTELSGFDGTVSQDTVYKLNKSGNSLYIGINLENNNDFQGYMAEVIFCDGQSYAPTQFGESKNGVWIPKDPSGTTFGNNGFHLKFENASDLGNDSSGNNNDFTVSNMGTDHQVIDTPTTGAGG